MNARKYLAELLGTFLFMMVGYMSVPAFQHSAPPASNLLVVPFAFGLGLLAAIFAFGGISGGHFNPAVTVAMRCWTGACRPSRASPTSSPRSSAPSRPPSSSCSPSASRP